MKPRANKRRKPPAKKPELYQSVWITFSNGERAGFLGPAAAFPGDTRTIAKVEFTEPKLMQPGYSFCRMP